LLVLCSGGIAVRYFLLAQCLCFCTLGKPVCFLLLPEAPLLVAFLCTILCSLDACQCSICSLFFSLLLLEVALFRLECAVLLLIDLLLPACLCVFGAA
jgi:hypothetical protein